MEIFNSVLIQMLILFAFIAIGFLLVKIKAIPDSSAVVLSKLENFVFVPALVMGTFIDGFTIENIEELWKLLLFSVILLIVLLPFSFLFAKLFYKDDYVRKIAVYGLEFSNFAFMGNAVVKAVFPEIFFNYTVFTLPFWFGIYAWGAPTLLIGDMEEGKKTSRLKNFINPMLIAMLIGMIIGLTGLKIPVKVTGAIDLLGDCMSPIAMILTGATIATSNVGKLLKDVKIYLLSIVRLVVFPLIFILIAMILPKNGFINETVLLCGVCVVLMPMGLNAIVIPLAYGKDTSVASTLVIVTHLISVVTIPLVFLSFNALCF